MYYRNCTVRHIRIKIIHGIHALLQVLTWVGGNLYFIPSGSDLINQSSWNLTKDILGTKNILELETITWPFSKQKAYAMQVFVHFNEFFLYVDKQDYLFTFGEEV